MTSTAAPEDGAASYGEAVQRLAGAQKTAKGGPAYTIYVNRWLGGRLAAVAYVLGLTPNAVTAISTAFSILGIAVIALFSSAAVLATPLLLIGYALDAADGQLARLRGGGSLVGEWLDHMVDAVKVTGLHLAVLIHLYRFGDLAEGWLLVPIGFTLVGVAMFFGYLLNDQLRRNRTGGEELGAAASVEPASPLYALVKLPVDFGVLCWSFVLLPWPSLFIAVYSVMFAATAAYLILALVKWYREMRALDAESRT